MRVPTEAGTGKAKITFSLDDWKEGGVTPATFEMPIEDPPPTVADTVRAVTIPLAAALAGLWCYTRVRKHKEPRVTSSP